MRKPTADGIYKWLAAGFTALAAYMLTLDSYTDIDWFFVLNGLFAHVAAGLTALSTAKPTTTTPETKKPVQRTDGPLFDDADYPEVVSKTNYFSQSELECKGDDCNCDYPGMHPTVMAMANDLREQFGPIVVTSAYRCPEHNRKVGGSSNSYHMRSPGEAIDLKAVNASPQELYDYLTAKYPSKYGIGLYKTFVHIDCRTDRWARKAGADQAWKGFDYAVS